MGKHITLNPFPPGTQFLMSNVPWDFTRRGVSGRTNKFTPQRSGSSSKTLWKQPHQLCCGGQCHTSYYKTRREGRAWAGLSSSKYGRAKSFSLSECHWPPFTQHSWYRNLFLHWISLYCEIPWALPALVKQFLPGLLSACCPFSLQQPPYNYKMLAPDELKNKTQLDLYTSTQRHTLCILPSGTESLKKNTDRKDTLTYSFESALNLP